MTDRGGRDRKKLSRRELAIVQKVDDHSAKYAAKRFRMPQAKVEATYQKAAALKSNSAKPRVAHPRASPLSAEHQAFTPSMVLRRTLELPSVHRPLPRESGTANTSDVGGTLAPGQIIEPAVSRAHSGLDVDDPATSDIPPEVAVGPSAMHALSERPPSSGELLISYLCPPDMVEAVLGCLEEAFRFQVAKHGRRAAVRWYWWCVIRSSASFIWSIANRIVWDAFKQLT